MEENNDIIDINIKNVKIVPSNKLHSNILYDSKNITIKIPSAYIPFGIEKYNNGIILNLELLNDNNNNNNIISKISGLENHLSTLYTNNGFTPILKKSKLGHIIRTHCTKSTECYIMKKNTVTKNDEKMFIDLINIQNSDCEIDLMIKGVYIKENHYGLYIIVKSIRILKFN